MRIWKRFLWGGAVGFPPVSWLIQAISLFIGAAYMFLDGSVAWGAVISLGGVVALYMMRKRMSD